MLRNTAGQFLKVFAFDTLTGEPITGDHTNITCELSLDNGTITGTNTANPTETQHGFYVFPLTQAETNANVIDPYPVSSTGGVRVISVPGTIYTRPANFALLAISAGGAVSIHEDDVDAVVSGVLDGMLAEHDEAGSLGAAVTAILADTSELQADWADDGRLDLILDSVAAVTVKMDDLLILDDTTWQFTDHALANAPVHTGSDSFAEYPSAEEVAAAVLDAALAEHVDAGSLGQAVAGILDVTDKLDDLLVLDDITWQFTTHALQNSPVADSLDSFPDAVEIAEAVLDRALAGHTTAGSLGHAVAAILEDTDELHTDWTDGGRLDLLLDDVVTVTDKLDDLVILDDTVWQFTEHALMLTPGGGSEGGGDGPDAAEIAAAVLDEALAGHTSAGSLGYAVSAILADTSELQADWADDGRLDNILDSVSDVTDKLDMTLGLDDTTWQFTEHALANAPVGDTGSSDHGGDYPDVAEIVAALWGATLSAHTEAGSFGQAISDILTNTDEIHTNVETIQGITAKLDTMLVLDDTVWQFTENALANLSIDDAVAAAVMDATLAEHTSVGSLGHAISDILSDTSELQADWADDGRLDLILDSRASQSTLDTVPRVGETHKYRNTITHEETNVEILTP